MRTLLALFLIAVSLALFGPVFYPLLDADQALHVLMGRDFSGLRDGYYWGQDRLGSLLPLLAKPLNALFNPLWAYTVAMALVLWACFNQLRAWVPQPLVLPAFTFLLFPAFPWLYAVLPGQPYLAQTLFLLLGIRWFQLRTNSKNWWVLWVALATLGVWASELSAIFFVLGTAFHAHQLYRNEGWVALRKALPPALATGAVALLLLLVLKNQADNVGAYLQVWASPDEVVGNLQAMSRWTTDHLLFLVEEWGTSVAFILTLITVTLGALLPLWRWKTIPLIAQILWLTGVCTLIFLPFSHWVALMGADPRYFIPAVAAFALAAVLSAPPGQWSKGLAGIMTATAVFSVVGFAQVVRVKGTLVEWKPARQTAAAWGQQSPYPAIATYWMAYPYAVLHSGEVVALPHDREYVRNAHQLSKLMQADTILVLGSFWLDHYPDTLVQFGQPLLRAGTPDTLEGWHGCVYRWDGR
jgi:hypothetical protein